MADERTVSRRFPLPRGAPWTPERIADELVPQRDRLVSQLPREIAAARDLTTDQRELVIDDAIDFMVTEYAKPIIAHEELRRAFWAAASFRVKRAHEGRGATVRAGFRRAPSEDLDVVAADDDPERAVVSRDERLTLLEFVSTLTPREREVFACKYGSGSRVAGRNQVSRWLGLPIGEVRKAERNIAQKLDRFITLVSAGALCSFRSTAIQSLAADTASGDELVAARLHLKRCPACQRMYAERVRALRSGELQRDIAGLLPLPVAERLVEERGPRGVFLDWITRPFNGDPAGATALMSSGAGRGAGTIAAAKLASLCIAGAAVTGGVCVSIQQLADHAPNRIERRAQSREPAASQADPVSRERQRRPRLTPTPTPATKKTSTHRPNRADESREHERATAISPAPDDAQAGGVDEFGPSGATGQAAPATPPSTGAPEFP